MVQAQGTPGIALTGLHHRVGTGKRDLEGVPGKFLPALLAAVVGSHIVHIDLRYLRGGGPAVRGGHHPLNAGTVIAVHPSEDPVGGHPPGIRRSHSLLGEYPLGLPDALGHIVHISVVLGLRCHTDSPVYQEKTRGGNIPELAAGLHHHVYPRTAQFLRGYQPDIGHTAETVVDRLHTEHIEYLGNGRSLRLDELAAPEGIADLAGQ